MNAIGNMAIKSIYNHGHGPACRNVCVLRCRTRPNYMRRGTREFVIISGSFVGFERGQYATAVIRATSGPRAAVSLLFSGLVESNTHIHIDKLVVYKAIEPYKYS